jgi:hypothetical protein
MPAAGADDLVQAGDRDVSVDEWSTRSARDSRVNSSTTCRILMVVRGRGQTVRRSRTRSSSLGHRCECAVASGDRADVTWPPYSLDGRAASGHDLGTQPSWLLSRDVFELFELGEYVVVEVAGRVGVADVGTYEMGALGFGGGTKVGLELLIDRAASDDGEEVLVSCDRRQCLVAVEGAAAGEAGCSQHLERLAHLLALPTDHDHVAAVVAVALRARLHRRPSDDVSHLRPPLVGAPPLRRRALRSQDSGDRC